MQQKVIKVGRSSLAVIIPAHFIHDLGIHSGDCVKVQTNSTKGKVEMTFSGILQLPLPSKS